MTSSTAATLHSGNVIADVLASETSFSSNLTVVWPDTTLDTPGKELGREDTQPEPTLYVNPSPNESHNDYVLIMSDPDLMTTNDQTFGQVRHWLAKDVTVDTDGKVIVLKEANISPYIGPAPLPNYISPRPHRYVFILARPQSGSVTIEMSDLQDLQKQYPAFEGTQVEQDLKDRWGFNAQRLIETKNLEVIAATYMLVGGTLKSTLDNAAMTAQAGLNKVLGK